MGKIDIIQTNKGSASQPTPAVAKASEDSVFRVPVRKTAVEGGPKKTRAHKVANNKTPHRRQRAKTLLRSSVKKPNFRTPKGVIHQIQGPTYKGQLAVTKHLNPAKLTNAQRIERARQVAKNQLVNRFSSSEGNNPVPTVQPIAVKQPVLNDTIVPVPLDKLPMSSNPFETAVARSNSHLQAAVPTAKKPGTLKKFGVVVLVLGILGGSSYYAYREFFALNFAYAGYAAKIQATRPGWMPAGYKLNFHIGIEPGEVTLNYINGHRSILLSEESSSWDNQTLVSEYVSQNNQRYETKVVNGKTVYLFSDTSATWLSNGLWYRLSNQANISSQDVLEIAATS